jgi:hypothetical protein
MYWKSLFARSFSLLSHVVVHPTSLSRMILDQIYTLSVAVVERFTAIAVVLAIAIAELFLFSLCCRELRCVPLAPLCSPILEPDLRREEESLKINHIRKSRCVLALNHEANRLIGRLFEMVYLAFFIATSYGVDTARGEPNSEGFHVSNGCFLLPFRQMLYH